MIVALVTLQRLSCCGHRLNGQVVKVEKESKKREDKVDEFFFSLSLNPQTPFPSSVSSFNLIVNTGDPDDPSALQKQMEDKMGTKEGEVEE